MRILDENGNEIVSPDLEQGYLREEKLLIAHHDATPEQGHEEVKEYPNGGKSIRWVVDTPAVEAWDEYEDILRYILYTAEELAERQAQAEELARYNELILDGVTWADLAAALAQGVNSL